VIAHFSAINSAPAIWCSWTSPNRARQPHPARGYTPRCACRQLELHHLELGFTARSAAGVILLARPGREMTGWLP